MWLLGRIHQVGVAALIVTGALLRIAVGLAVIGGCVWVWNEGYRFSGLLVILGALAAWGLINMVLALGAFGSREPDYDRRVRREIRKALRRSRMVRRW
jgi:hypothetical protein